MPEQAKSIVTNTTQLIALTAATGNLDVLRELYARVVVPHEVAAEIRAGGKEAFGIDVFEKASWLEIYFERAGVSVFEKFEIPCMWDTNRCSRWR